MIAIPNMDMPKSCWDCELLFSCKAMPKKMTADEIGIYTVMRLKDCPLIEIVQCKECKHSKVYALQSDAPMKRWCHRGHFPKEVTDYYFCGDGGRRK